MLLEFALLKSSFAAWFCFVAVSLDTLSFAEFRLLVVAAGGQWDQCGTKHAEHEPGGASG